MKIERLISWFFKENEELAGEYNIDYIPLSTLKKIFNPPEDDPLMYNPYDIDEIHMEKLKEYIDNISFEFDKYYYPLDCFSIDNQDYTSF